MNSIEDLNIFFEIPDTTVNVLLDTILINNDISNKIIVSDNVYTDTNIDEWLNKKPTTIGGMKIIDKIIKTPINNKELLIQRQKSNYELLNYQREILKNNEKDLLWIMTLKDEIDDDLSINLLFPSTYLINNMNYSSYLLDTYHFYKIILMPMTSLIYPLSILYTPYYYINRYLQMELTFSKYMGIIYEFLKLLFKLTGNIKSDLTKIITIFIYLSIYIYSIYQTFYISYIIYKTREKLFNKLIGLVEFIKTSITIIKQSNNIWKSFFLYNNTLKETDINNSINNLSSLDNNLATVYKLWKNANYKDDIINLLKIIYTIDAIDVIYKLKKSNKWCLPTYDDTNTKIWDVNNPLLSSKQISNPVNLSKNIIITGVNAGGKTTYVKSIAINIILAQTIGIINGIKGNIYLYDAIITFMRISDELGSKSYFEAETSHCNNMINVAEELNKANKRGLFLMDEPMHSTPPIEGVSVAFSVAEYLAKLKSVTLIITTHFHNLIELEDKYKSLFINLNVNATYNEITKLYEFNYKINRGGSKQIIAIELLEKHKFNKDIINSAIEMKNKLYNQNLRNVHI
uniref:DNA mismatch repair proteins mutS family domain-containing protein n=1 Tax=viral metagenome TaxID=1070528 RepID=A0A6C0ENA9_9ZZZZ